MAPSQPSPNQNQGSRLIDPSRLAIRSWHYGLTFIVSGIAVAALAWPWSWTALPLGWVTLSWLAVGSAYILPYPDLFRKRRGRLSPMRRTLLAPYLALQYALWHLARSLSSEPAYAHLTEQVLIGRRLLKGEYPKLKTLVDCTAEFDENVPDGVTYLPLPLLDGMAARPDALREVAGRIAIAQPPVYIHCAQGHGRTAMVAASVLLASGGATTVDDALASVKRARPGARLSRSQLCSLQLAFSGDAHSQET